MGLETEARCFQRSKECEACQSFSCVAQPHNGSQAGSSARPQPSP